MRLLEGGCDVLQQVGIGTGQSGCPGDQNIVMAGAGIKGEECLRRSPEAAFGAVAGHGIADFAAGGEPYPIGAGLFGRAEFQRHGGADFADTALGAQKLRAFLEANQRDGLGGQREIRPRAFYGHGRGGGPEFCDRPPWPYARGIRGGVCGRVCWADMGAS